MSHTRNIKGTRAHGNATQLKDKSCQRKNGKQKAQQGQMLSLFVFIPCCHPVTISVNKTEEKKHVTANTCYECWHLHIGYLMSGLI